MVCGVPQGSVLGPLVYTSKGRCVGDIMCCTIAMLTTYSSTVQRRAAKTSQQNWVLWTNVLTSWSHGWIAICSNLILKKTEFIIFSSKKSPGRNITPSLPWHLRDINISSHVRSLGVIFDSALSFAKHTDYIIKSCNFYIRNIGPIRQFLSKKACGKLVVALVTPPHPLTIATLY